MSSKKIEKFSQDVASWKPTGFIFVWSGIFFDPEKTIVWPLYISLVRVTLAELMAKIIKIPTNLVKYKSGRSIQHYQLFFKVLKPLSILRGNKRRARFQHQYYNITVGYTRLLDALAYQIWQILTSDPTWSNVAVTAPQPQPAPDACSKVCDPWSDAGDAAEGSMLKKESHGGQ